MIDPARGGHDRRADFGSNRMAVTIYRYPSDASGGAPTERYVLATGHGWFEVACEPGAGGWRVRKPYFGPRAHLAPIAASRSGALRVAIDYPGWLDAPDQ
jgi:hypothetical protein